MDRPALDAPAADWLVYGDSLQLAGDPRGELISLAHAVAEGRAEAAVRDAHIRRHWKALLGKCPPTTHAYELAWHYCLVRAAVVRVRPDEPDPVGPLLGAPAAAALEAIEVRGVPTTRGVDLALAVQQLATRAPASCRSFSIIDERAAASAMLVSSEWEPDMNLVTLGPLAALWPRAEALSLEVADAHQLALGDIDAPALRSFALRSLRFTETDSAGPLVSQLAAARWPELASFELRLTETWNANVPLERDPYIPVYSAPGREEEFDEFDHGRRMSVDWSRLAPLLKSLAACPLRRLALTSCSSSRSLLEAIARGPLPPSLEELDLSDGAIVDADVAWMLSHPAAFQPLRRIVLERTSVTAAAAADLRRLGPEVIHSEGEAPGYRYVVGQE